MRQGIRSQRQRRKASRRARPARPAPTWVDDANVALLTDFYELTMAQAYWKEGLGAEAVFSLFVRRLPPRRNYLLACGLDDALRYLETLPLRSGVPRVFALIPPVLEGLSPLACTSPVAVPAVVDYADEANAAFRRFAETGMHVVRSANPIASWPGIRAQLVSAPCTIGTPNE